MLILRVGPIAGGESCLPQPLLRANGVSAEHAESGRDALEFLRLYDYDLILIDLETPEISGPEVIRLARAAGRATPSILVAVTATPRDKVRALDLGADDFIMVPCDPKELLARIRAVVRRSQGHAVSTLKCGPVELSLDRHEVRVSGKKLSVSRKEFGILELLFLKHGVILNKHAFLDHLYGGMGHEPMEKTIDVIICRLRKKLADVGVPELIHTVWGCGYLLREPSPPADSPPL